MITPTPEPSPNTSAREGATTLGTRFIDDVAEAIARICTHRGVTADAVADSFCDLNGYTTDPSDTALALTTLAADGRVRIEDERYFWHTTDGVVW